MEFLVRDIMYLKKVEQRGLRKDGELDTLRESSRKF